MYAAMPYSWLVAMSYKLYVGNSTKNPVLVSYNRDSVTGHPDSCACRYVLPGDSMTAGIVLSKGITVRINDPANYIVDGNRSSPRDSMGCSGLKYGNCFAVVIVIPFGNPRILHGYGTSPGTIGAKVFCCQIDCEIGTIFIPEG